MSKLIVPSLTVMTLALLACGPAQATGISRAWVSGRGTDAAGCGAPTNPCRSLQYTHDDIVAPNGEIDILDPAGYGAINITKSISIVNDGVGTAGVQTGSGAAITIDVAGANTAVALKGLNIDGLGTATDGIDLNQVGKLTLTNCVIRHFVHDAMYLQPTTAMTLSIINVTAADNGRNGFNLSPSGGQILGFVDHSYGINNGAYGLVVWGGNTANGISITASHDVFSNNVSAGVVTEGSSAVNSNLYAVENVSDNDGYGYDVRAGSVVTLSRSEALFTFGGGVFIEGGQVQTYKNNEIGTSNGSGSAMTPY